MESSFDLGPPHMVSHIHQFDFRQVVEYEVVSQTAHDELFVSLGFGFANGIKFFQSDSAADLFNSAQLLLLSRLAHCDNN